MNYKMMGRFIAQILFLEGVFMVPPLCISLYLGETMAIRGFSVTIAIIALLTALLLLICRGGGTGFYATEGAGESEIRIAYVRCEAELERALDLLRIAIERYNQA